MVKHTTYGEKGKEMFTFGGHDPDFFSIRVGRSNNSFDFIKFSGYQF
jgi:hypothetical protein